MNRRSYRSMLDAVISCDAAAEHAVLSAAVGIARRRRRRRRAGRCLLGLLIVALPFGWMGLRQESEAPGRAGTSTPTVATSPWAQVRVHTTPPAASFRVATAAGPVASQVAWRVRTGDLSAGQGIVRSVSDADLLALAGGSGAALVYHADGVQFVAVARERVLGP